MALDKLVDSSQLDTDLTYVANAIRTKGGTSAQLAFPADFVTAINAISGGGGVAPAWATITEITIGANSVTEAAAARNFFSSYAPYVTVLLASAITSNNQLVGLLPSYSGNGNNSVWRYRNNSLSVVGNTTSYDVTLVEGSKYYVFSFA